MTLTCEPRLCTEIFLLKWMEWFKVSVLMVSQRAAFRQVQAVWQYLALWIVREIVAQLLLLRSFPLKVIGYTCCPVLFLHKGSLLFQKRLTWTACRSIDVRKRFFLTAVDMKPVCLLCNQPTCNTVFFKNTC